MFIVCVHVNVLPAHVEDFKKASLENSVNSVNEPLCKGFDVLQQTDEPTKFMLIESYVDATGFDAHKETAHYEKWRTTVDPWMSEPRKGVKHTLCK